MLYKPDLNVVFGFFFLFFFCWNFERNLKSKMWFQDNNITFWRNFVGKYFATNAKKRWCVSLYGSGGRQPTGIFPQVCFVILYSFLFIVIAQ